MSQLTDTAQKSPPQASLSALRPILPYAMQYRGRIALSLLALLEIGRAHV